MKDMFKMVNEFDGFYKCSDSGFIFRVPQVILRNNGTSVFIDGGKLKGRINKQGYCEVNLRVKNKSYSRYVHRLIALAFIPNPDNKPCVNHKDGNKQNNSVENLEWCTRSENSKHAFDNGLNWSYKGENHKKSKLNSEQVLEMRSKYIPFVCTYPMLAKEYGVSVHTVRDIIRGESWKHLNGIGVKL